MFSSFSSYIVPSVILFVVVYGYMSGIDVFATFISGAKTGLKTAVSILPTLIGLLMSVYMLRASGAIDMFAYALEPVLSIFGIPAECAPLILLKPISGGGGLAIGSELITTHGVDSLIGRISAVILSASETSIYTIGLYFGHLKIKDFKYTLKSALLADIAAFISAVIMVKLVF